MLYEELMWLLTDMVNYLNEQMEGMEEGEKLNNLRDQLTEVQDALCEIEMMDLDQTNVFIISQDNNISERNGGFAYKGEGNVFNITINNGSAATLAHELKHGFQYLEGKVDFWFNKQEGKYEPGILYGIEDEIEAFRRKSLLGGPQHTDSQIEKAYKDEGYGSDDLGAINARKLGRYKNTADKEIMGKKKYKYNSGYANY